MCTSVTVTQYGPVFSFLLLESNKCSFQQEGFLLGEIVHQETKTITDNDQQQLNITDNVKLQSVMPCPQPHYFYDNSGRINENHLREFLGDQFKKVIGWYKFQRVPNFRLSVRDKILHKQLINIFESQPELFVYCLLKNEVTHNASTHTFSQMFYRYNNNRYEQVPICTPNLGEPNISYKCCEPVSQTFINILQELKIDRKTTPGLEVINKIQNAVQKHIDSVVTELAEAESELFELEEEVKQLQIENRLRTLNTLDIAECVSPNSDSEKSGICSDPKTSKEVKSTQRGRGKSRPTRRARGRRT